MLPIWVQSIILSFGKELNVLSFSVSILSATPSQPSPPSPFPFACLCLLQHFNLPWLSTRKHVSLNGTIYSRDVTPLRKDSEFVNEARDSNKYVVWRCQQLSISKE